VWHRQAGLTAKTGGAARVGRRGRRPHRDRTRRSSNSAEVDISHVMLSALVNPRARDPPFGARSVRVQRACRCAPNGQFGTAHPLAPLTRGNYRGNSAQRGNFSSGGAKTAPARTLLPPEEKFPPSQCSSTVPLQIRAICAHQSDGTDRVAGAPIRRSALDARANSADGGHLK
jgi:hypothetical protein